MLAVVDERKPVTRNDFAPSDRCGQAERALRGFRGLRVRARGVPTTWSLLHGRQDL